MLASLGGIEGDLLLAGLIVGAPSCESLLAAATAFAKLIRALLVAVPFTAGAWLRRIGRALNSFFPIETSPSRCLRRSSRCSLSFRATASPGRLKFDRVSGFADLTGFGVSLSVSFLSSPLISSLRRSSRRALSWWSGSSQRFSK